MKSLIFRKEVYIPLAILALALSLGSSIALAANEGLLGQWNGSAASGFVATDSTGGNNGAITLIGVDILPGKIGSAFSFNGGYIKMDNPKDLNFGTKPFSLEVLFKWDGKEGVNNIIRKSNYPVTGDGAGYWLRIGNGTLEFFAGETVGNEGGVRGRVSAEISRDVWYRAIATRESDGTMRLYLNGALQGSKKASGADTTSEAPFTIGAWDDRFGVTEFFSGLIEEVSVYNRALSASEVQSRGDTIGFPIPELGNCGSEAECRAYCNEDEHIPTCIQYSIDHDRISKYEKKNAEKLLKLMDPSGAPGECRDQVECLRLCDNVASSLECVAYAERNGLFHDENEREIAQKMAELLAQGIAFPGNCATQDQCEAYCGDTAHADECVAFSIKAGFMKPEDADTYKKVAPYIKSGETPGKCKTKDQCETYCENTGHIEECFLFAEKAGLIPQDELKDAKKAIEFMKRGETPGGCRSKQQCEDFCNQEDHAKECLEFGLKSGIISEEEAGFAKKFLESGGPGGCKTRQQCDAFCNDGANQSICLDFAEDAGLISNEDADFFKKNLSQSKSVGGFDKMPAKMKTCIDDKLGAGTADKLASKQISPTKEMMHVMRGCIEEFQNSCPAFAQGAEEEKGEQVGPGNFDPAAEQCFKETFGEDVIEKLKSGDFCPPADMQERLKPCFEKHFKEQGGGMQGGPQGGQGGFPHGDGQGGQGGFQGGPGGCKSQEECTDYCNKNPDACKGFQPPPQGSGGGEQGGDSYSGPSGCKSQEECTAYCQANPDACKGFQPPPQQQQQSPPPPPPPSGESGTPHPSGQTGPDCSSFAQVPQCSFITDPSGYNYCKQCYPDR